MIVLLAAFTPQSPGAEATFNLGAICFSGFRRLAFQKCVATHLPVVCRPSVRRHVVRHGGRPTRIVLAALILIAHNFGASDSFHLNVEVTDEAVSFA